MLRTHSWTRKLATLGCGGAQTPTFWPLGIASIAGKSLNSDESISCFGKTSEYLRSLEQLKFKLNLKYNRRNLLCSQSNVGTSIFL
jgi:hypothetical protein